MSAEYPPDVRAQMWIMRILQEEGAKSVGALRDRVPFGRDRLRETLKKLEDDGRIIRDGNGIYPSGHRPPESDRNPVTDRLKATENPGLVPPHAPPPKDLKTGFSSPGARVIEAGWFVCCVWYADDGSLWCHGHDGTPTYIVCRSEAEAAFVAKKHREMLHRGEPDHAGVFPRVDICRAKGHGKELHASLGALAEGTSK